MVVREDDFVTDLLITMEAPFLVYRTKALFLQGLCLDWFRNRSNRL